MINYLKLIHHPKINHERFFEVLRDFRKGGLNPDIWDEFIHCVREYRQKKCGYDTFEKFNLSDISFQDHVAAFTELQIRCIEKSKICWHPKAGPSTCNLNNKGEIIISAAHSIQNNRILSKIAENGYLMTFEFNAQSLIGLKPIGRSRASIFWGFCNKHDAIFNPIDADLYEGREIQHFLFAYRAFIFSAHLKMETSCVINHGIQSDIDIQKNKQIFDQSILAENYCKIITHRFELSSFYPVTCSGCFYLEYDFNSNEIVHSMDRMEFVFLTVFPTENDKTIILISYFEDDAHLYAKAAKQIEERSNLKYDISILIAALCPNAYFKPSYYQQSIAGIEASILEAYLITHFDIALLDNNNQIINSKSVTPENYLSNPWNINLFKN